MGILLDSTTGRQITLGARILVGRSGACALRIQERWVSGEHALLRWDGGGWHVRDLGSSNGTFVDGDRMSAGEERQVGPGQRLGFGAAEGSWELIDEGPPEPSAMLIGGTEMVHSHGAVLLLPSEGSPERSIYRLADGEWVCDGDDALTEVVDRAMVSAGGRMWRLHLPTPLDPTSQQREALALTFEVSRDEEYVELEATEGGRPISLGHRGYTYLLLTLARQRLADEALPEPDRGWVHQDELAHMLRISASTVNVQIHRARQHASRAGIQVATELVERRHRTRQLRLGVAELTVRSRA